MGCITYWWAHNLEGEREGGEEERGTKEIMREDEMEGRHGVKALTANKISVWINSWVLKITQLLNKYTCS